MTHPLFFEFILLYVLYVSDNLSYTNLLVFAVAVESADLLYRYATLFTRCRAILRSCTRPGLKVWSCSSSCGSIRPGSVPPGGFPACSRCCTACSVLPWSLSASQIPSSAIWLSAGSRWGSFCVFLCLSRGSGCCSGL